ncbi:MAG: YggS family pyridoxal phosphate-dependent enzyme [Planctomycetes bacterium]|nr:YggS family pyridoxal phosphate-dependent enzyme [Planctomycetota bacterium]
MAGVHDRLAENLARVRETIAAAAARSGRPAEAVTLVAVTKYTDLATAERLLDLGCLDLGESRPQQLWERAAALGTRPVRWHMIGHLQRNKAERTLPLCHLVHSGDSLRLLEAMNATAIATGRRAPALIEVNISGDATKHGFQPAEIAPLLPTFASLTGLDFRGLMGMASREGDRDQARREFADLRQLRDQLAAQSPAGLRWDDLSMGMSGDYDVAIEAGATIVRVGSALFEEGLGARG